MRTDPPRYCPGTGAATGVVEVTRRMLLPCPTCGCQAPALVSGTVGKHPISRARWRQLLRQRAAREAREARVVGPPRMECMVPESPEVIEQAARHLRALYLRLRQSGRKKHRSELHAEMDAVMSDPIRMLRVSMMLGTFVVDPIRDNFNLEDPAAGIHFTSNQKITAGELAAGRFINALLKHRYDLARESFEDLEEASAIDGGDDLIDFFGFLLAMAAAR